jgi:peptidyl-prolyl cis-trans isomerase C
MRASTLLALGFGLFATAWQARPVQADSSPAETTVIARVGTRAITAAELERRMMLVPPFQLRSFGKSDAEVRKNFLERVIVREVLLAQGGLDAKLDQRDEVQERLRGVLRNAFLGKLRADASIGGPISEDEVKRYYEANAVKYHSPPRVNLWRIQKPTREAAAAVLEDVKKDPSPKHWTELARDSLDKATNQRGGNLGYVAPDGTTAEPGFKVDPAVLAAADKVKDAELVPEPVKDGDRWSVVWKRQSVKAVDRLLADEAPSIRQILAHEKAEKAARDEVERLRKERLTDYAPEQVDEIDVSATGDLQTIRRPGTLQSRRPAQAAPIPGPAGLLR